MSTNPVPQFRLLWHSGLLSVCPSCAAAAQQVRPSFITISCINDAKSARESYNEIQKTTCWQQLQAGCDTAPSTMSLRTIVKTVHPDTLWAEQTFSAKNAQQAGMQDLHVEVTSGSLHARWACRNYITRLPASECSPQQYPNRRMLAPRMVLLYSHTRHCSGTDFAQRQRAQQHWQCHWPHAQSSSSRQLAPAQHSMQIDTSACYVNSACQGMHNSKHQ
jgi:hypothetical protein